MVKAISAALRVRHIDSDTTRNRKRLLRPDNDKPFGDERNIRLLSALLSVETVGKLAYRKPIHTVERQPSVHKTVVCSYVPPPVATSS